jgi:hypothetical protein
VRIIVFGEESLRRVCLVAYARPNDADWGRLGDVVGDAGREKSLEICQRFGSPVAAQPRAEGNPIAVLLEIDKKRLLDLMVREDPLWDVPGILIIPGLRGSRVELARRILPRFLAAKPDERSDLARIKKKLKETTH